MMTLMDARELAKSAAPQPLLDALRWRRAAWVQGRLRLLNAVGYAPSHELRDACYRLAGLTLPSTSSVRARVGFYAPEQISIGEYTTISEAAVLDGRSGLRIGSSVNIGSDVRVWTRQRDIDARDFAEIGAPVTIGDYAYLGNGCTVLPGVTIGEGGVVGAGSVVTQDVPAYTLVAGVPARTVRKRSRDLDYRLGSAQGIV